MSVISGVYMVYLFYFIYFGFGYFVGVTLYPEEVLAGWIGAILALVSGIYFEVDRRNN